MVTSNRGRLFASIHGTETEDVHLGATSMIKLGHQARVF